MGWPPLASPAAMITTSRTLIKSSCNERQITKTVLSVHAQIRATIPLLYSGVWMYGVCQYKSTETGPSIGSRFETANYLIYKLIKCSCHQTRQCTPTINIKRSLGQTPLRGAERVSQHWKQHGHLEENVDMSFQLSVLDKRNSWELLPMHLKTDLQTLYNHASIVLNLGEWPNEIVCERVTAPIVQVW